MADLRLSDPPRATEADLRAWFVEEVLPLEQALTRYLGRNWNDRQDIADLRQEIYAKLLASARLAFPDNVRAFMFAVARNHLINARRRTSAVAIDPVADLDALEETFDLGRTERYFAARDELRQLQAGLDRLPPRCRQVVLLRKVNGFSQREVAACMGVTTDTVERQMVLGMRALVDFMTGGSGQIDRQCRSRERPRSCGRGR